MDSEKAKVLEEVEAAKKMVANNKDYKGARSKLLEVNCQCPGLQNVLHMITACDILCASELTLDGETDWYWILQLSPEATTNQIRLKYKRLVALLEGIKVDFPGALTALKLVHDASAVLSSTSKSWVFNSKRLTSKSLSESFVPTVSSLGNDMEHHNCKSLSQEQDSHVCESSDSKGISAAGEGTLDVDERSLTPVEIDDPYDVDNQWNKGISSNELNIVSSSLKLEETHTTQDIGFSNKESLLNSTSTLGHSSDEDIYNFDGTKKAEAFEVGQIWAAYDSEKLPRRYARISYISESPFRLDVNWLKPIPKTENERKWCEVRLPVVCGLFDLHEDEESLVDSATFSHLIPCTSSPTYDEFEILPQEDEVWAVYKDWTPLRWLEHPEDRKGCRLQIVQILEGYTDQEGVLVVPLVKVDWSHNIYKKETEVGQECNFLIPANHLYRFSHQLPVRELGGNLIRVSSGISNQDTSVIRPSTSQGPSVSCPSSLRTVGSNSLKVEWTGEDFAVGQVWAIYDGHDRMPRQYVVINRVFSNEAVEVTYLEPNPNPMDNEEISWIEEKLPVGCGIFKLGSRIAILQMNKLSHLVNCDRTNRNMFFRIYPKKGEIWAMYRNWSRKWKQQDFGNYQCQIVEIISDLNEPSGLQTASLEEVPGYRTFFQKQHSNGFALNCVVPRSEMLSFSHKIEAYVVPGIEAYGIPECSWHLEPDALPPLHSNA